MSDVLPRSERSFHAVRFAYLCMGFANWRLMIFYLANFSTVSPRRSLSRTIPMRPEGRPYWFCNETDRIVQFMRFGVFERAVMVRLCL